MYDSSAMAANILKLLTDFRYYVHSYPPSPRHLIHTHHGLQFESREQR